MTKETEPRNINPEQTKNFLSWCRKDKIARFLIDGDDTLWGMVEIFRNFQKQSYQYLFSETGVDKIIWEKRLLGLNDHFFEQFGVNPSRWDKVVEKLAIDYSLSEEIKENALKIFRQIYTTPPVLLPGTKTGLEFLKQSGVPFSLVTHANKDWTDFKIRELGLFSYFSPKDIHIIDENGHKTSQSWLGVINFYGLKPKQCAVIGDSPRTDINPVWNLGVKQAFLLKRGVKIWSVHDQPINKRVKTISSLEDLRNLKP